MSARRKRKPAPPPPVLVAAPPEAELDIDIEVELAPPSSQTIITQRVPEMADAPISSSEYDVVTPDGSRSRAKRTGRWNTEELAEWVRLSVAPTLE